ncbi:MAG: alpha/beta hydrolase family protein [Sporichthyaceae bacterium]
MSKRIRITAAAALALSLFHVPAEAAADVESVRTDQVCFSVHNAGDSEASAVWGQRYWTKPPTTRTPVIVLVHPVGPAHEYWDRTPEFSVARSLARAGYLVIAYDRLGYAKSPYAEPKRLTLSSARDQLHEMVTQIHDGSYTAAERGDCATAKTPVDLASDRVVIVGTSGGGAIVNGYAGTYRDVSAVIPIAWSNAGFAPDFLAYLAGWAPGAYSKTDDYLEILPDEASCAAFVFYAPGLQAGLERFCRNGYNQTPWGEFTFGAKIIAENRQSIYTVPDGLPILQVTADRDRIFSPEVMKLQELDFQLLTRADVEAWTQPNAGHAPAWHESMPQFTAKVTDWLTGKGIAP